MSKYKKEPGKRQSVDSGLNLSAIDNLLSEPERTYLSGRVMRYSVKGAICIFVLLLAVGVFAKKSWFPHTDHMTGKKTGWFGIDLPKTAASTWNPLTLSFATPTPQLMKEYIYAGSRLLSSVDASATEIPPEDLAVWRPSNGTWRIYGASASPTPYGQSGDIPVQGDYDGDGKTDFSVMRPSPSPVTWYVTNSSDSSSAAVPFGNSTDIPVVADYDGDGKTDIAVWRPSNYYWYIRPSSDPSNMISILYGTLADAPVPADYDGDGKADIAIWRATTNTFYWKNSSNSQYHSVSFGSSGDIPVCADYDGDGKANFALKHNDDWIIMNASYSGTTTTTWSYSGGTPVPNDYDGDGLVDIAVWKIVTAGQSKPVGIWYIRQSSNQQLRQVTWGATGDIPVPALYRR